MRTRDESGQHFTDDGHRRSDRGPRRDVRPEAPIWSCSAPPTSSLRIAAEAFVKEWYGGGFAIGPYAYEATDGVRRGTFRLRGGIFTHQIAYHEPGQRFEVRVLDG